MRCGNVSCAFVNVSVVIRIGIDLDSGNGGLGDLTDADELVGRVVHFQDIKGLLMLVADRDAEAIDTRVLVGVSISQVLGKRLIRESRGQEGHSFAVESYILVFSILLFLLYNTKSVCYSGYGVLFG